MSDESNNSEEYSFPRRINDPTLIAVIPIKQFVPTMACIIIGAYSEHFWIGLIAAIAVFFAIGRVLKDSYFDVIIHKFWAKGMLDLMVGLEKTRTVVNPLTKRFFS